MGRSTAGAASSAPTGYCYANTFGRRKREQAPALHRIAAGLRLECDGLPPLSRKHDGPGCSGRSPAMRRGTQKPRMLPRPYGILQRQVTGKSQKSRRDAGATKGGARTVDEAGKRYSGRSMLRPYGDLVRQNMAGPPCCACGLVMRPASQKSRALREGLWVNAPGDSRDNGDATKNNTVHQEPQVQRPELHDPHSCAG
jgi:hypothetical protein